MNAVPIFSYQGKKPLIDKDALVSPLAVVIGNVEISKGASVWPGAVVRGDVAKVTIGECSNVQDNAVLHGGDVYEEGCLRGHLPVEIGDYVTVAHGAVVHGSKVEDVSMIGIRSVVFEGSIVEGGSIIGINAVVPRNSRIPKRSIAVGVPAKVVKSVDEVAYSRIRRHASWYHALAKSHEKAFFNSV